MSKHAILSPSSAARWLACTPSARLEEQFPDRAGDAAAEGTLAHSLGELLIQLAAGQVTKRTFNARMKKIEESKYYNADMQDLMEGFRDFVIAEHEMAKKIAPDAELILETKLDLTEWVADGFGTADVQIVADDTLHIIDLKYGKGVTVAAEENKQMMLYGLGALRANDAFWDIREVKMTIYQPRVGNVSSFKMRKSSLIHWAINELKPKAERAYAGEGEFAAGDHCMFCKAKAVCRTYAERQLEIAKYEFKDGNLLSEHEVADILSRAAEFKNWLGKVEEHALVEAVDNGVRWPGFKLVEGRSNRVYADPDKVAEKLTSSGIPEETIYEKKMLGITAMEKAITKKTFSELLGDLVIKPQGKPTLVPESDKRPEWNSVESAIKDFKD
jgi:hypothetical protein